MFILATQRVINQTSIPGYQIAARGSISWHLLRTRRWWVSVSAYLKSRRDGIEVRLERKSRRYHSESFHIRPGFASMN